MNRCFICGSPCRNEDMFCSDKCEGEYISMSMFPTKEEYEKAKEELKNDS